MSLTGFFDQVVATDASATQIRDAIAHDRIRYHVAPAERSDLDDSSIDLITVAQALHWFQFDAFYNEATRVSTDGAILAAWSYERCKISPEIDNIIESVLQLVEQDWPAERDYVWNRYRDIHMPWPEISPAEFDMTADWTAEQMLGYLGTWSASKRFTARTGENPLASHAEAMRSAWGSEIRQVRWPLILRVCRRPRSAA